MKKLLCILMALSMILSMGITAFAAETHEITNAAFPFYYRSINTGEKVTLYFLDGVTDLPYVEVNDWGKIISSDGLGVFDGAGVEIRFSVEADGPVVTFTRHNSDPASFDNGAPMTIDFEKDTIAFQDYNVFCLRGGSPTIIETTTMSTHNDAGEPTLLQKVDKGSFVRYGNSLTFDLGAYGIDLIMQDGLYLIPLQTLSDILMPNTAMGCLFFNGQALILAPNVSDVADVYYAAPTGERSEALAEYGYNELCMMLDHFYGLKDTHRIQSFQRLFQSIGFEDVLKGGDVRQADGAVYRLITDFLSDGHSHWLGFSYLTGPMEYEARDAANEWIDMNLDRQEEARAKFYPDGIPGYEEIGNTAYISFDTFMNMLQPDDYYTLDPADYPEGDVIGLMIKAHEQITREGSPIENVVLDMSANSGGSDSVSTLVVAWMLGEANPSFVDMMTGAMTTNAYRFDANLDRVFDEKDTLAGKKLFCLASSGSFSNGNYVPCTLKASGRVTLLGRATAGGACTILPASTAWGTSFQISSNVCKSFLKNGAFYDIDRGVEPDYALTSPESFYDRVALTDYINDIK